MLVNCVAYQDGSKLADFMPWRTFAKMSDVELSALWAYLRTLPPHWARILGGYTLSKSEDNGSGIDAAMLPTVFSAFTTRAPGTASWACSPRSGRKRWITDPSR